MIYIYIYCIVENNHIANVLQFIFIYIIVIHSYLVVYSNHQKDGHVIYQYFRLLYAMH